MAAVRLPAARYAGRSRCYVVIDSAVTEDRRACIWGASACTTSGLLSCGVATQSQASAQQDECKTAQLSIIKIPDAAAWSGILRARAHLSSQLRLDRASDSRPREAWADAGRSRVRLTCTIHLHGLAAAGSAVPCHHARSCCLRSCPDVCISPRADSASELAAATPSHRQQWSTAPFCTGRTSLWRYGGRERRRRMPRQPRGIQRVRPTSATLPARMWPHFQPTLHCGPAGARTGRRARDAGVSSVWHGTAGRAQGLEVQAKLDSDRETRKAQGRARTAAGRAIAGGSAATAAQPTAARPAGHQNPSCRASTAAGQSQIKVKPILAQATSWPRV